MFDLKKSWMYEVKASPEQCEGAFIAAFTEKRSIISARRAHWSVTREAVPGDDGRDVMGVVATMDRPNALRSMSEIGRSGAGSSIAFSVDSHDDATGSTSCQMFLLEGKRYKKNNITPAVVANSDILKSQMKLVHRKLMALDPSLTHARQR